MERLEEELNILHEAVFILNSHGSGEQPALHDEPEDVVERLETLPDPTQCLLAVSVGHQVGTVPDTGEQALEKEKISNIFSSYFLIFIFCHQNIG